MMSKERADDWDERAERRLLKHLIVCKPVGVLKHFQIIQLAKRLNAVCDDEDTDFEDILTPHDLAKHDEWKASASSSGVAPKPNTYEPSYKVRPTEQMVWDKLETWYDLNTLDKYEYVPDEFSQHADFFLPDGDFSELLRDKEEQLESSWHASSKQPQPQPQSQWRASQPAAGAPRRHVTRATGPLAVATGGAGSKRSLGSPSPTSLSTTTSRSSTPGAGAHRDLRRS